MSHSSSLGYGDYRDRAGRSGGSGFNLAQFPPTTTASSSASQQQMTSSSLKRLTSRVESFFGSLDHFSSSAVSTSRILVVHCLNYPYIVFSRQCQVYPYYSARLSLAAPFTSVAVLHHIAHRQGMQSWWRGWYSHVALNLLAKPFADAAFGRLLSSSSVNQSKWRKTAGYLTTRGLSHLATIPLLSYSLLEMVQTTTDKVFNSLFEVTRERPFFIIDKFRRIPYLYLVGPTLLHGITADVLTHLTHSLLHKLLPHRTAEDTEQQDVIGVTIKALWSSYFASLLTDIILYPLETVLVRLYCQGMPVLVDNIQTGSDVVFISTYYSGCVDCMSVIWESEGVGGFYKGFSSLLIRYLIHGMILLLLWRTALAIKTRINNYR